MTMALPTGTDRTSGPEPPVLEPLTATHERYVTLAGTPFATNGSGHEAPIPLELVAVSPLDSTTFQESFSLEFTGPASRPLEQGIHALEHERLGHVDVFLVPIGREGDRIRYEAVFNRLVRPVRQAAGSSEGNGAR